MQRTTLREISKFASGLVLGDFLVGLWFYAAGMLPFNFFGIEIGRQGTAGWMLFDAIVFLLLVHYGWRMGDRKRTAKERKFHLVAGTLFGLVALFHLTRIIFGWNLTLGGWQAPYWLNGLGAFVTAILSYVSFGLARKE